MYKYILVLVILLAVSCGSGSPVGVTPDPPVKTVDGYWTFAAQSTVPDGWPSMATVYLSGGSSGVVFTLPDGIAATLGFRYAELRNQRFVETATFAMYDSDRTFSIQTGPANYVMLDYFKSGNGDYLTLKYPDGEGGAVVVVYDAVKQ